MNRSRGFSLLETLAALALLGVLLLGVYSGVRSTTLSVSHGSSSIARLDELRGAREFLRRGLSSATALPWKIGEGNMPIVFEGDVTRLRFVSVLPGYLGKLGPQVIEVALTADGERGQALEARLEPLPGTQMKTVAGTREFLVTHVRSLSVRYARRDSPVWLDRWPDPIALPGAVEITVVPEEGKEAWPPLVVAPRQDPDAVNVRMAAFRLPDATP
jgi:general secretion pathway protein J